LKMMHTIASHTSENRMTASAVAACMAPLLLRPLLAGECEMDEVFDMDGDDSAQLLAAANAANSAQGIIATLLEEYEGIFHDEHLRCSLSPESQIEDSGTEASTDDGNLNAKGNGFHDAENDVDQEMDDDNGVERILSGKLSESSGYAGSDLYDYKAVNADESDAERPVEVLEGNVNLGKARKSQHSESVDSSGEEELAIQRLEIAKNDLQNRIAKEVSRLQEQLQAERDLRAALEVGLSMSSGQFSSARSMDVKTRAELEEIALAEADVARLKQKVAELHLQLNQQRQHQYGPAVDANDRHHRLPGHFSQQNFVQQGFDMNLAFCNQEKQRNEESSMESSQWRNIKQHVLPYGSSRPLTRKLSFDASSSESRGMEASTSMSTENTSVSINVPKLAEGIEYGRQPMVASSTLVELTTRLDFFKERRSQLMEQLHSLDLGHGSASQGFPFKSPSPWNHPR
ncbi:Rho GTPase-activating protein 7, partial [Dichanthelium oligosanthes]